MLELLALLIGFYVAWNIGSNDSAKAIGTSVRSHAISYRNALLLMSVFAIAGTVLAGSGVSGTMKRVVTDSSAGWAPAASIALLCAGLWVTLATIYGFPVSTTQSIIGAFAGAGLAMRFAGENAYINTNLFGGIVLAWLLCPFLSGFAAYISYRIIAIFLHRVRDMIRLKHIFSDLALISAVFTAFMIGSNDGGNLVGAVVSITGGQFGSLALVMVGVGIAVGALTFSRNVIECVGCKIVTMSPIIAFTAQFGASLVIFAFNILFPFFRIPALPVSSTQAIVGGIIGAGLARGSRSLNTRTISGMVISWILTPVMSFVMALAASYLVLGMI